MKLQLTKEEKNALYIVLSQSSDKATYRDVYFRGKLLERLESKRVIKEDGNFSIEFDDKQLEITDSEFEMMKQCFKEFKGWTFTAYPLINSLSDKLKIQIDGEAN